MPKSPRAARRAARPSGPPRDLAGLRAALDAARLSGHPPAVTAQARSVLLAWFDGSPAPFETRLRQLSDGTAVTQIGRALGERMAQPEGLACAAGCAFCCILPGEDGATITRAEAVDLYTALAAQPPVTGAPWHPEACPSLDPETRLCRVYDARPMICRTYVSRDVAACEAIAEGQSRSGTGTLPPQLIYMTAHALVRAALGTGAPTFALKKMARAATTGVPLDEALGAARHPPRNLDAERRRLARSVPR